MQENLLLIKVALNLTVGAGVDDYIRSKKLVKGVDIVMNVVEAINLLKKYNLYEDAEAECNRLRLRMICKDFIMFIVISYLNNQ